MFKTPLDRDLLKWVLKRIDALPPGVTTEQALCQHLSDWLEAWRPEFERDDNGATLRGVFCFAL